MTRRSLSDRLGEEARALPGKSHGWFRTWFRKVWNVRGGGLYACGFAIAFIYFEAGSLAEDLGDIGSLFNGQAINFLVNILVDSIRNTVKAFMWPAFVAQFAAPWGAIGLGLAFALFPMILKKPIEKWLFSGQEPASQDASEDKDD